MFRRITLLPSIIIYVTFNFDCSIEEADTSNQLNLPLDSDHDALPKPNDASICKSGECSAACPAQCVVLCRYGVYDTDEDSDCMTPAPCRDGICQSKYKEELS